MGSAESTASGSKDERPAQPGRNQVVPVTEAYDSRQLEADTARLRKQLEEVTAAHSRTLEAAAVAERKRLDDAATAERVRQDEAAVAVRKQLDEEAAAARKHLDEEAATERERRDEEASAQRARLDEKAAAVRKQLDEDAAAERARKDEEAAAARRQLDEAAAAERQRLDDAAAAERKRLGDMIDMANALLGPVRPVDAPRVSMSRESATSAMDDEAAAVRRRRADEEAAIQRRILDEAAAAARRRLDEAAAAERRRLDEEAAAERRRLAEAAAAMLGALRVPESGPVSATTSTSYAPQADAVPSVPAPAPADGEHQGVVVPEKGVEEEGLQEQEAVDAANQAAREQEQERLAAAAAAAEAEAKAAAERERQQEEAQAAERREKEAKWQAYEDSTPEELRAHIPPSGASLAELPESLLDLHDGMPAALRQAPMRLLVLERLLQGWTNIKVYEDVDVATEAVEMPYGSVTEPMWDATIILSWRWDASKPAAYIPGFSPMSQLQFTELVSVLRRAQAQGLQYAWIDWCCVPQYSSDSMVEVLRSKVYYARARAMAVVPTFYPIPAEGIVRLLLVKASRVIKRRADAGSPSAEVAALVGGRLESMLAREQVAGREYFSRVWTLAERMARFGRPEHLSNWLSLEAWLGMLVDALLKSTDDRSASAIYKRILGPSAGAQLDGLLDPLAQAVRTGSMHVVSGLEEQLADLFETAVAIWRSSRQLSEAPTPAWLLSYLQEAHSGVYAAWNDADRVWAVYSYFCWKTFSSPDGAKGGGAVLEALRDLVRVAGGGRRHLMGMATKLGLAHLVEADEADRKLLAAAASNDAAAVVAALEEGAYPDAPEVDGKTSLHHCAEANNADACRALLEAGASTEIKTANAETPLFAAAARNCVDAARVLLGAGAKVDAVGKAGFTPLHKAAEQGYDDMARLLIQSGAKKEALTLSGDTPLAVAVRHGKESVLRALADAGANKTFKMADGWTLLHEAAQQGHVGVAKMLLSFGAAKDAANKEGCTPLHIAARRNKAGVVQVLAEAGANLGAVLPATKATPLHECAVNGCPDAAKALIGCGAPKEARNQHQRTPLMVAAAAGAVPTLKVLLQEGCHKEAADNDGWRAIHLAAHFNKYHAVVALKEAGASTTAKTKKGHMPYEIADTRSIKDLLPKPPPTTFFGLF